MAAVSRDGFWTVRFDYLQECPIAHARYRAEFGRNRTAARSSVGRFECATNMQRICNRCTFVAHSLHIRYMLQSTRIYIGICNEYATDAHSLHIRYILQYRRSLYTVMHMLTVAELMQCPLRNICTLARHIAVCNEFTTAFRVGKHFEQWYEDVLACVNSSLKYNMNCGMNMETSGSSKSFAGHSTFI